jgi:hypothetical protein
METSTFVIASAQGCFCQRTNADDRYSSAPGRNRDRSGRTGRPHDFDGWLADTTGTELLKPAPDDYLQVWPVSRQVNSSRAPSDDSALIERVAA